MCSKRIVFCLIQVILVSRSVIRGVAQPGLERPEHAAKAGLGKVGTRTGIIFGLCSLNYSLSSGCGSAWFRALGSGPRSRRFKSSRPDHLFLTKLSCSIFIYFRANPPEDSTSGIPKIWKTDYWNITGENPSLPETEAHGGQFIQRLSRTGPTHNDVNTR